LENGVVAGWMGQVLVCQFVDQEEKPGKDLLFTVPPRPVDAARNALTTLQANIRSLHAANGSQVELWGTFCWSQSHHDTVSAITTRMERLTVGSVITCRE